MTPEERDRLRTLEVQFESMNHWLKSIDSKVEEVRTAAHMGKGAWVLLLKLGGIIAAIAAFVAWLLDKIAGRHL